MKGVDIKMKYFYIYNPIQANFFHTNGVPILEIGKGKKNDIYIKFPRNDKSEHIFSEWVKRCNNIK